MPIRLYAFPVYSLVLGPGGRDVVRTLFALILLIAFVGPSSADMFKPLSSCEPNGGQALREIAVLPISEIGRAKKAKASDFAQTLKAAGTHPLGSQGHPVRVFNPAGQRVYLASLRCTDGRSPTYCRKGNVGKGPFGTIVDLYDVRCPGSMPAQSDIYLDMYHADHLEETAPPGFAFERPKVYRMKMRRNADGVLEPDDNGDIDSFVFVADIRR
jgi:hypothetical protein